MISFVIEQLYNYIGDSKSRGLTSCLSYRLIDSVFWYRLSSSLQLDPSLPRSRASQDYDSAMIRLTAVRYPR